LPPGALMTMELRGDEPVSMFIVRFPQTLYTEPKSRPQRLRIITYISELLTPYYHVQFIIFPPFAMTLNRITDLLWSETCDYSYPFPNRLIALLKALIMPSYIMLRTLYVPVKGARSRPASEISTCIISSSPHPLTIHNLSRP
jgi:hypothetical protein